VVKVIDGDRGGSVPSTAFPIGPVGNRRCTEARSLTDVLLSAEGDRASLPPFSPRFKHEMLTARRKGPKPSFTISIREWSSLRLEARSITCVN